MNEKEAFALIDVLRSHQAANLFLDLESLGWEFKGIINNIGMWKAVFYTANYDELADLLYLYVIEKVSI
jgi:hypothetical protein